MNVIFFPLKFAQDAEKLRQLEIIQEHLYFARVGLENRIRGLDPWSRLVERQRHFATIRAHVKALAPIQECPTHE